MPLRMFQVTGDMDFEVQVEAEDENGAIKAVNNAVRVWLYHKDGSEYDQHRPHFLYMEVTDSNVIADTTDVEEIEI